jgi:NTE family protein
VQASCSIPGYFKPIEIDGKSYVDGGAWSPTNMDAAKVERGDLVVCLNPTGSLRAGLTKPGLLGVVSSGMAAAEELVLERRGARVVTIRPDSHATAAIGPNLMDGRRRANVIAAGVSQGRAVARETAFASS